MPQCQQCEGLIPVNYDRSTGLCPTCRMLRAQDPRCPFVPGQLVVVDGLRQRLTIVHYIPGTDTVEARTDYASGWVNLTPLRDRANA